MRAIKSHADIVALQEAGYRDKVMLLINQYFKHMLEVYESNWDPKSYGYIVLLEDGDPLNDKRFLESIEIRGHQTLVSEIKEFYKK